MALTIQEREAEQDRENAQIEASGRLTSKPKDPPIDEEDDNAPLKGGS